VSDVTRYRNSSYATMDTAAGGGWVRFSDYARDVAALREERDALRGELDALRMAGVDPRYEAMRADRDHLAATVARVRALEMANIHAKLYHVSVTDLDHALAGPEPRVERRQESRSILTGVGTLFPRGLGLWGPDRRKETK